MSGIVDVDRDIDARAESGIRKSCYFELGANMTLTNSRSRLDVLRGYTRCGARSN